MEKEKELELVKEIIRLMKESIIKIDLAKEAICNSLVFDIPVIENRIKKMNESIHIVKDKVDELE